MCGIADDAGDELFAVYDPFRALRAAVGYARWGPRSVRQAIRLLAARLPVSHRNMSTDFKIKRALRGPGIRHAYGCPGGMRGPSEHGGPPARIDSRR
jgi:asparagine synthase (glutamine-hydrolysing)